MAVALETGRSVKLYLPNKKSTPNTEAGNAKIKNIFTRKANASRALFPKTTVGTLHPFQESNCPSFGGTQTVGHTPRREATFKWRTNIFIRDDLLAVILEQLYLRLFITMEKRQRFGNCKRRWYIDGKKVWDWKATWFNSQSGKASLFLQVMAAELLWSKGGGGQKAVQPVPLSDLDVLHVTYVGEIPSPNPLP